LALYVPGTTTKLITSPPSSEGLAPAPEATAEAKLFAAALTAGAVTFTILFAVLTSKRHAACATAGLTPGSPGRFGSSGLLRESPEQAANAIVAALTSAVTDCVARLRRVGMTFMEPPSGWVGGSRPAFGSRSETREQAHRLATRR